MNNCGCPFRDVDLEKIEEICKLTDKPTNGAMKCDFTYEEDCAEYKNKIARGIKSEQ